MLKSACYIHRCSLLFVKKTVSLMERNFILRKEIVYMLFIGLFILALGVYMIIKHFD